MMPEAMVRVADSAFARMVAACGAIVSLFTDADGTAQREALRRWHMATVRPLARLLEHELTMRLEITVRLRFDGYPKDLQARAATTGALVAGGVPVNEALTTAGLLDSQWPAGARRPTTAGQARSHDPAIRFAANKRRPNGGVRLRVATVGVQRPRHDQSHRGISTTSPRASMRTDRRRGLRGPRLGAAALTRSGPPSNN